MNFLRTIPIAHRGLHGKDVPENSLAAFLRAAEAGYAVETDVRLSKDGTLVVFHDDTLTRMTGDPRAVSACTLRELKELSLCGTKEKIPTFAEFLAALGEVPLLLEIKNMPQVKGGPLAERIAAEFARSGYRGEYAVQSFQPLYVRAYRTLLPHIPCGVLSAGHLPADGFSPPFARIKRRIVTHMSLNAWVKPDFISVAFGDPPRGTEKFKGVRLSWTVRSEQDEKRARALADNIIFEGYRPKL